MDFSRLLLLCLPWLAVLVLGAIDVAAAKARSPSCATRCGDIDVPYPFGMSELCAIHSRFTLDCMGNSNGYSRLFHAGLEVTKISVEDNKAWLKTYIAWQCYNVPTNMMRNNTEWKQNITETPYVLSANDNKIIVLGCGTLASMRSDSYIIGCLSTCDDISPQNGSCSGAGCCQADLPRGVRYYEGLFNEYNSSTSPKWRTAALNCSYVLNYEKTVLQ